MAKSAIYTANTAQVVAEGGAVAVGNVVRRFGCNLQTNGGALALVGAGYYYVNAVITFAPDATNPITITAYQNGVEVASATTTAATGLDVAIPLTFIVRNYCAAPSNITFTASTAGTVSNADFVAIKL